MKKVFLLIMALLMMALAASVACTSGSRFEVVSLDVTPLEVPAGETISITAEIKNIGGSEGTYTAILTVDGMEVDTKNVTVTTGSTELVTFSLTKDTASTYEIGIGELSSTLTVVEEVTVVVDEVELKYDDGGARDFLSSCGGYLVDFDPQAAPFKIKQVRICGVIYGYASRTNFEVEIWDKDGGVLHSATYPVTMFALNVPNWVEVEVPDIEVTDKFHVHVYTGTCKEKGIHVGADDSVINEHSDGTTLTAGSTQIWTYWPYLDKFWFGDKSKVNWMIRVIGTTMVTAD